MEFPEFYAPARNSNRFRAEILDCLLSPDTFVG